MVLSILTALSAALFFIFFVATKRSKFKTCLGVLFFVFFACGVVLSVVNEKNHIGMVEKTVKTQQKVESIAPGAQILLKDTIDKAGYEVVAYKVPGKDKVQHTVVDEKNTVQVVQNEKYQQPILETATTKYDYKNKWMKFLFDYPNQDLSPVKEKQTFYLNSNFKVLTKQQLEELKAQVEKMEQMKQGK